MSTVVCQHIKHLHVDFDCYIKEIVYVSKCWILMLVCIWRRHHCRWTAANFELCSALMAVKQWGFFSVSHLLWHGTYGHLRGPVKSTLLSDVWQWNCHYMAELLPKRRKTLFNMELSLPNLTTNLGMSPWIRTPEFPHMRQTL